MPNRPSVVWPCHTKLGFGGAVSLGSIGTAAYLRCLRRERRRGGRGGRRPRGPPPPGRGAPQPCPTCSTAMNRVWAVNAPKPFQPHFNASVGAYVSNESDFRDALRRANDQAGMAEHDPVAVAMEREGIGRVHNPGGGIRQT